MAQEFETLGTSIEGSMIKYTKQIPRENANAKHLHLHLPTKEMRATKDRNRFPERNHKKLKFIELDQFKC